MIYALVSGGGTGTAATTLRVPTKATLKRYGLTTEAWEAMAAEQGFACYVCEKVPPSGRLCVDHEHAKGWKKLPPERRREYVRGLLCWTCNHYYVGRSITPRKARRVVEYLEAFEARRPAPAATAKATAMTRKQPSAVRPATAENAVQTRGTVDKYAI